MHADNTATEEKLDGLQEDSTMNWKFQWMLLSTCDDESGAHDKKRSKFERNTKVNVVGCVIPFIEHRVMYGPKYTDKDSVGTAVDIIEASGPFYDI